VGAGASEAGINAEDPCGGRTEAAPGAEDEVRPCPSAGTPKAVAGCGASAVAEVEALIGAVGVERRGVVGVVDVELPMIGAAGADSCAPGAVVVRPSGTNPGVDAVSRCAPSGGAGIICGYNTL
jgi:hypothetical protein